MTSDGVDLHYEMDGQGECVVLTHGSWTDSTGWADARARLRDQYRVVVWDRRGHSRSAAGDGPGSRAEDAADLAAVIESVSDEPVHLVGNSYGANVTLTLATARPELIASAAVHEPPLWRLLEGTRDHTAISALASADTELAEVRDLIRAGEHRRAAEHFVENVALGAGMWERLPEAVRTVFEINAPTYLDELADETALSIDIAGLAKTEVPLLLSHGTESSALFATVIAEIGELVPSARTVVLDGAGHIPHTTHTEAWVATLVDFHRGLASTDRS